MAETTAVQPAEKVRLAAYNEMSPVLQKKATELNAVVVKTNQGQVMAMYVIGKHVAEITRDAAKFGDEAIPQLSLYLGIPTKTLYHLNNIADRWTKEYVAAQSGRQMSNGSTLELAHWVAMLSVDKPENQQKFFDRVFNENLSASALALEIQASPSKRREVRQGGRKPTAPSSPIAGLQKVVGLSETFMNYIDVLPEGVFKPLNAMPADKVTDGLLAKLQETKTTLHKVRDDSTAIEASLDKVMVRVQKVLNDRPPAEKPAEKKPAAKPAAAKKKKPAGRRGAKPAAQPGVKPKPSGRPQRAAAVV